MNDMEKLKATLKEFNSARNWEHFHSPKNLSLALCSECGELAEIMRWLTEEQSDNLTTEQQANVEEELADIFIFLTTLADRLDINLIDAANRKIQLNEQTYSVKSSHSNALKQSKNK